VSLYLCVWSPEGEADGLDLGGYADFGAFRKAVADDLEGGRPGSRFPTLQLHSDCDGEWSPADCAALVAELGAIASEFRLRPPRPWSAAWQSRLARSLGLRPANALESFIDPDGSFLIERLRDLALIGRRTGQPLLFQ
jgi:hypothetical protein